MISRQGSAEKTIGFFKIVLQGNEVLPGMIPNRFVKLMTSVMHSQELSAFLFFYVFLKGESNMLLSLALVFLCSMALGGIFTKLRLPPLLGMLLTGILLGPFVLDLLDPGLLAISADLRKIALITILTRAGLSLDLEELKKVGRPALLMCFLPATFEMIGTILLAPVFLGLSLLEAALLGTVIAAVSPAVVVPQMLKLMDEGYGTKQGIPQMILAGASADDVYVIVLFTSLCGLTAGDGFTPLQLVRIPTSVVLGVLLGGICGVLLGKFFEKVHLRDSVKVLIILSLSFLLVTLEDNMQGMIGFSGLLAVMSLGTMLRRKRQVVAARLSLKFSKLWVGAELLLFVLVGAAVDLPYAAKTGVGAVLLIFGVLLFRMAGVFCCVLKTKFTWKERLFAMLAYLPKATVQAAIGSVPLAMGLACGQTILAVAVTAILITAPLGAFLIQLTYRKLLQKDTEILQ